MQNNSTPFLEELGALANLLGGTSGLKVVAGAPSSGWSIDLRRSVISADAADIEARSSDFCRGLILHEIGHLLITRYAQFLPYPRVDVALHSLFNVLEDIRLETMVGNIYPGAVAWVREYNNALLGLDDPQVKENFATDVVGAFLLGLVNRFWWGKTPDFCHAEAAAAIEKVWPAVERLRFIHPPATPPLDPEPWERQYSMSDLPGLFAESDAGQQPDAQEMAVRLAQLAVYSITHEEIIPVYRELLEKHGKDSAFLQGRQAQAFMATLDTIATNAPAEALAGLRPVPVGRGSSDEKPDLIRADDPEAYPNTVGAHQIEIQRLATRLREIVTEGTNVKPRGGYPEGLRLNLRVAMQAEADPRLLARVFQRPAIPKRPDLLVMAFVDVSGSMRGEKASQSFAGLCILREACRLAGLPLSIFSFTGQAQLLEHWRDNSKPAREAALASILSPRGGTRILAPLEAAAAHASESHHHSPVSILITDGQDGNEDETRAMIDDLESKGHRLIGIGLGPETEALADLLPGSATGISPSDFPDALGQLLQDAVADAYGQSTTR